MYKLLLRIFGGKLGLFNLKSLIRFYTMYNRLSVSMYKLLSGNAGAKLGLFNVKSPVRGYNMYTRV